MSYLILLEEMALGIDGMRRTFKFVDLIDNMGSNEINHSVAASFKAQSNDLEKDFWYACWVTLSFVGSHNYKFYDNILEGIH